MLRPFIALASILLCLPHLGAAAVDYLREVKPLLATSCVQCHGAANPKAGLRLDTAAAALKGSATGSVITPGKPEASLFITLLRGPHDDQPQMPYKRNPLMEEQIAVLSQWIAEGAKAPAQEEPSVWTHWAFVAPKKNPADKSARTATHPIDSFINSRSREAWDRAESAGRARHHHPPSFPRSHRPPPSVAEVDAFTHAFSESPESSIHHLVSSLLASPHYGERWGRWWLDQARYADSNGYSIDGPRSMWPYRDWVVKAFNANQSFDQFTIEQVAGDLLEKPKIEQLVATGFHRNTQVNGEGGIDPEQFRIDAVFDRVGTTGTVWLGLTIACAQCHDHKFDPITQREFYGLFAFFNNCEQDGHGGTKTSSVEIPDAKKNVEALKKEQKELEAKIIEMLPERLPIVAKWEARLTDELRKKLKPEEKKALAVPAAKRKLSQQRILFAQFAFNDPEFKGINDRLTDVESDLANKVTSLVMKELPEPRETHLFIKGDFTRPSVIVPPLTPHVLPALAPESGRTPNRLDLAKWLVGRGNPLTARVIMNRVWQVYFGKGLVETENDFGTQGSAPVNQELLDWLACEFMDSGWDLKHMHEIIVTSEVYLRSSSITDSSKSRVAAKSPQSVDPLNRLLWRQNRLRLDAEMVRDVCLEVTGLLDPRVGGPPVYPPIPDGAMNVGQVKRPWPTSKGPDRYRRGLYTFFFRASPHPALTVFDAPDSFTTCTRRMRSNTPLQALTLLNDAAHFEFAQAMEEIIEKEGVEGAFRRCLARQPTDAELATFKPLDALTSARVLLNLDETITRE